MTERIRWGILAPGGIAHQFVADLLHAENAVLQAVGSRTKDKAQSFADQYGFTNAYGSYEELVADPDVDIIYVATPHPYHLESAQLCMRAGKSVLCEKPLTVNAQEAEQMVEAAKENNVFLMEAMWTRYLPAIRKVRSWLDAGMIGDVKLVQADFGFRTGWNPGARWLNRELGGGALLDVGVYSISFASWVYGRQPNDIQSVAHIGQTDVDEWFTAIFDYGDGQQASIHNAVRLKLDNAATIYGTEGRIHIPNFFAAKSATVQRYGQQAETFHDERDVKGYVYQAEEAMRCLRSGLKESPDMTWQESIHIMKTMDTLRKQWNVTYPTE